MPSRKTIRLGDRQASGKEIPNSMEDIRGGTQGDGCGTHRQSKSGHRFINERHSDPQSQAYNTVPEIPNGIIRIQAKVAQAEHVCVWVVVVNETESDKVSTDTRNKRAPKYICSVCGSEVGMKIARKNSQGIA